jgi:cob(I)alamin adenosyltransferase
MLSRAVSRLEAEIDALTSELSPLKNFILPGGVPAAAWLQLCRCVCRRAEREVARLASLEQVPEGALAYLNRLSDFLFTAARWANAKSGRAETVWHDQAKPAA